MAVIRNLFHHPGHPLCAGVNAEIICAYYVSNTLKVKSFHGNNKLLKIKLTTSVSYRVARRPSLDVEAFLEIIIGGPQQIGINDLYLLISKIWENLFEKIWMDVFAILV